MVERRDAILLAEGHRGVSERNYLSIGEVLDLLVAEFPDVTISKIRFLESRGLIDPQRTPSGYRKFYDSDVERLGWILRQQREHFLPLKVIKGRLEAASGRAGTSEPVEPSLFDDDCTAPPVPSGALVGVAARVGAFGAREQRSSTAQSLPSRSGGTTPASSDVARRGTPRSAAPVALPVGASVGAGAGVLSNPARSVADSRVSAGDTRRPWAGRERPTSWPVVAAPTPPGDRTPDLPVGPTSDVRVPPQPDPDQHAPLIAPDEKLARPATRATRVGRPVESPSAGASDAPSRPVHAPASSGAASSPQAPASGLAGLGFAPVTGSGGASEAAGDMPSSRRSSARRRQGTPAPAAPAGAPQEAQPGKGSAPSADLPGPVTARRVPAPPDSSPSGSLARGMHLSGDELAAAAAVDGALIAELEEYGLLASRLIAGVRCYDEEAVVVARLAGRFRAYGIESRHLRTFKHAAEREAGLFSQVVMPLLRQRNPAARERAAASLTDLSELGAALQAALVRGELRDLTGG